MSDHHSGFTVDLAGVRSFGAGLHADLTAHLSPERDQIHAAFLSAPSLGARTASPVVQAAVTQYYEQVIGLLDLMGVFLGNGAAIVQAAEDVVAAYSRADQMSGSDMQAVLQNAKAEAIAATEVVRQAGIDPTTGRAI